MTTPSSIVPEQELLGELCKTILDQLERGDLDLPSLAASCQPGPHGYKRSKRRCIQSVIPHSEGSSLSWAYLTYRELSSLSSSIPYCFITTSHRVAWLEYAFWHCIFRVGPIRRVQYQRV